MINYKELRIGNCIRKSKRRDGVWCNEEDIQILNISKEGLNLLNPFNTLFYEWKWFEPIQITPDLLIKLGFVFDKDHPYDENSFGVSLESKDLHFYYTGNCLHFIGNAIHSLHQLQNLVFILTGEELEYTPCK